MGGTAGVVSVDHGCANDLGFASSGRVWGAQELRQPGAWTREGAAQGQGEGGLSEEALWMVPCFRTSRVRTGLGVLGCMDCGQPVDLALKA